MKNKFILVFAFFAIFFSSFLITEVINEKIFEPLTEKPEVSTENNEKIYKYKVSVFNGKLAVFEGDSKIPYKVYDTYVSSLPEEDKKILTNGIYIDSSSELMKIIEEYTS